MTEEQDRENRIKALEEEVSNFRRALHGEPGRPEHPGMVTMLHDLWQESRKRQERERRLYWFLYAALASGIGGGVSGVGAVVSVLV